MTPRRILITPLLVLLSALMVLIIIQMGARARGVEPAIASTQLTDPLLRSEQTRIDAVENSITRCSAAEPCTGVAGAVRLRAAAASIDRWPAAPSLTQLRAAMQEELMLRADLLELTVLVDVDGVRTESDYARLTEATEARYDSARTLVRRRIDAKLDPKSELLAGLRRANAGRSTELGRIRVTG